MTRMLTQRSESFRQWVSETLRERGEVFAAPIALQPIAADASSRHFYRVEARRGSFIAIDSPPLTENNEQYARLSRFYIEAGLRVPDVLALNLREGFLLVTDLGQTLMHDIIDEDNADTLYARALNEVIRIQCLSPQPGMVPPYERERLEMELSIFSEWLLVEFLDVAFTQHERALLAETTALLVDAVDAQPKVCIHRDFHSRNLVVSDAGELGIVDFQDSLHGAYAYDPVSLLRDCYVTWPQTRIEGWARQYHRRALDAQVPAPAEFDTFMRDFDMTGVQRHLKAVGIFARLHLRDERDTLLEYIPPVLRALIGVSVARPELEKFGELLAARVLPIAERRIESAHP